MRSTLAELSHVLDELEQLICFLLAHEDPVLRRYATIRKQLDYTAFIVSIYVAFEQFVQDIVWSYTDLLSSRTKYSDLPKKMIESHVKTAGELLARARLGEGRYSRTTEADVVNRLHSCLSGQSPYQLVKEAVVHHDLNLRTKVVGDIFSSVGIENINERATRIDSLNRWYCKTNDLETLNNNQLLVSAIDHRLMDLVERRNQVSHCGRVQSDLLGLSDMKELLEFIRAYCQALYKVVLGSYLHWEYVKKPNASEKLGRPNEIYEGGSVVVISKPTCHLFVNQPIIGARDEWVDRWGVVKEIQVDDEPVQSLEADSTARDVGLHLDFKVKKSHCLYLLQNRDETAWESEETSP